MLKGEMLKRGALCLEKWGEQCILFQVHCSPHLDADQNTEKTACNKYVVKIENGLLKSCVLSPEPWQNSVLDLALGSVKMREKYFGYFCGADPVFLPVF
jgi:hypothetical protein